MRKGGVHTTQPPTILHFYLKKNHREIILFLQKNIFDFTQYIVAKRFLDSMPYATIIFCSI